MAVYHTHPFQGIGFNDLIIEREEKTWTNIVPTAGLDLSEV